MHRHQHKSTRFMNNHGNMSSPKERKASITDSKKMEIYKPPDKEFRMILKETVNYKKTQTTKLGKQ